MNNSKKKELIELIAHRLDITPDMYNRSQSVVQGLTNYLKSIDSRIEIYKQGSFKLGTIIRPCKKDRDGDFDIDLVVQFSDNKTTTTPAIIKARLGEYLKKQNYRIFWKKSIGVVGR
jgi:predicted nucleotidyltransferase